MKISTRGRYALKFMCDLAQHDNGGYLTLKDISERQGISVKYLEQITALLSKLGLLTSVRGPQGGYRLSRSPESYTIKEILYATEGALYSVDNPALLQNNTENRDACSTQFIWEGLEKVIDGYLNSITLQTILEKNNSWGKDDYCI